MSIISLFPSKQLFLIQASQPIMISGEAFNNSLNRYKGDCFSIVEYLLSEINPGLLQFKSI